MTYIESAAIPDKYWDCSTYFDYQSVKDETIRFFSFSGNEKELISDGKWHILFLLSIRLLQAWKADFYV